MANKTSVVCKPVDSWPGEYTPDRERRRSPFRASAGQTMDLLRREIGFLDGHTVVLEINVGPDDLRQDGWPYAHVNPPPPVKLSFTSKHGPLVYATDKFTTWVDNIRAIALGLEALRKVERYGITRNGEQYKGWAALPPGTSPTTRDEAAAELATLLQIIDPQHTLTAADVLASPTTAVTHARIGLHPDKPTGDHESFLRVQELAKVLSDAE